MCEIIIFAGTTEGRELAEFLDRQGCRAIVCTATEYGGQLIANSGRLDVRAGRMDRQEMCALIGQCKEKKETIVVDATHPYAAEVTANIREACRVCRAEYIRLLRAEVEKVSTEKNCAVAENSSANGKCTGARDVPAEGNCAEIEDSSATGNCVGAEDVPSKENCAGTEDAPTEENCVGTENGAVVCVSSIEEAVEFLAKTEGNILVTTGSKELRKFTALPDYAARVYARVLSTPEVAAACAQMGFAGKHLICMQGPFTEELNTAMLRQFQAKWLVTKESGQAGGFEEKILAARRAGASVVLIGRPTEEKGDSLAEVKARLIKRLGLRVKRQISMVGIGMGSEDGMTIEAARACREAQLLVGARRILESFRGYGAQKLTSYQPEEIRAYLDAHVEYEKIALLQSGDVGFYSGAKRLYDLFREDEVRVFPGISSVVSLCAKLHVSWEDVKLVSLHGRRANVALAVRTNKKVFALAGKGNDVRALMEKLVYYGLGDVRVTVGENLSYPEERIRTRTAADWRTESFTNLSVLLIENPNAQDLVTHGLEDEAFLRDKVPMTKSEVRSISLSKLRLHSDSVLYDVGAGTGSVSVEAALRIGSGTVYAIEKKPEAAELIRANARKFAADNLEVIEGCAPEAFAQLPAPSHVFIGGSSGNLRSIIDALLQKNPSVRIVLNCIALETVAEALDILKTAPVGDVDIVSVSTARAKQAGSYHMMMGQNPVYILSATGTGGSGGESFAADISVEKKAGREI